MATRGHTPKQSIQRVRDAEVELAKGATTGAAAKEIGVTEHTYHRWRAEYGGVRVDQAKRSLSLFAQPVDVTTPHPPGPSTFVTHDLEQPRSRANSDRLRTRPASSMAWNSSRRARSVGVSLSGRSGFGCVGRPSGVKAWQ